MTVVKKNILFTLKDLERLYNSATTREATYYSKLAIIELCGWIEFTMDKIAEKACKARTTPYRDSFRAVVEQNYGFAYKSNFRKMMNQTIGLHNMEKLEMPLQTSGEIAVLEANLASLKRARDNAAHTHLHVTSTYQAPSATIAQLMAIYPILKRLNQRVSEI